MPTKQWRRPSSICAQLSAASSFFGDRLVSAGTFSAVIVVVVVTVVVVPVVAGRSIGT